MCFLSLTDWFINLPPINLYPTPIIPTRKTEFVYFGQSAAYGLGYFLKGSIMKRKALYARRVAQGLAMGLSLSAAQAWAALPAGVTAAITEATTDGVTLGGLMLALAVAVGVIFWLKRKV